MKKLVNLERLKAGLSKAFGDTLKAVDSYLQKAIFNQEVSELSQRELKQILSNADGELKGLFGVYVAGLKDNWRGLFTHRYHQQFRAKLKEPKSLQAYADKAMQKPLRFTANTGISLDEMLSKFSDDEAQKITRAIRLAHHEGLPNSKLIQMIRGSKARNYQDGILATTTRNAKTLAHTGTAIIDSQAKQQFIADHSDLVQGIRVLATLDMRTSSICRHLDGEFMPLDKAVYPPYHYNCRSSFEVVYDGYQRPKQRASMHGMVENQSYYEWLKGQDNHYQDEVLGKTRAKLFRDGGLSIDKFKQLQLDKNFTPITLKEMKELEPVAFDRLESSEQLLKKQKEMIKSLTVEYDYYVNQFSEKAKQFIIDNDLTDPEAVAIYLYTGNSHTGINGYLRGENNYDVEDGIHLISSALSRLKDYQGKVIRRDELPKDVLSTFIVGEQITFNTFVSSTYNLEYDVMSEKPHRLIIHSKHGKIIEHLSTLPAEQEVLFNKGTSFKILSKKQGTKDDDFELEFELEEL